VARAADETWGFEFRPSEWLRLARLVQEDPGNVELGARVFYSLGGHDEGPTHERFLRTETGRELVRNATAYPDLFTHRELLRELPAGSLGREYVRELDERGIDPVELGRLTQAAHQGREFSRAHAYVRDRVRQAHDLIHTLLGCGIDVIGEAGVLAFTFGQTGNKGWAMLVFLNALTTLTRFRFDGWALSWKAYRLGRRAQYLPARDDWDRLLRLPLEAARAELDITPLSPYEPLALDDALALFLKDAS